MGGRSEWGEETTAEREIKRASGAAGGPAVVHSAPLAGSGPPEEEGEEGDGGRKKEGGREGGVETSCVGVRLLSPSFSFFLP